jgi:predicted acylesterase/phospholipase RssA
LGAPAIEIAALSGTSAGAVNAVVLADGWLGRPEDPRGGARDALALFWRLNVLASTLLSGGLLRPALWDALHRDPSLKHNPLFLWLDLVGRVASPYELHSQANPLGYLLEHWYGLDATRLRDPAAPLVFLTATDVATGEAVVFDNSELTTNVVLASACLPTLVRAIDVKGRAMWDGGYSGNPALWPIVRHTDIDDVLIVQINPVDVDRPPETARDIINRINEITFNASLLAETRSLERLNDVHLVIDELCAGLAELDPASRKQVMGRLARRMREVDTARARSQRLRGLAHRWRLPRALTDLLATEPEADRLDTRQFEEHPLRPVALHIIHGDDALDRFDASSKFNTTHWFVNELFELGRAKAREWLARRLPVILANRAEGLAVSTFEPMSGLSGR